MVVAVVVLMFRIIIRITNHHQLQQTNFVHSFFLYNESHPVESSSLKNIITLYYRGTISNKFLLNSPPVLWNADPVLALSLVMKPKHFTVSRADAEQQQQQQQQ